MLNGYKDIEHIAEWAEEAEESIKGVLKFEFGPPIADTILRDFRNVNADKNEDYKRHRKDHSPENMTVMRRLALNILRQAEKNAV